MLSRNKNIAEVHPLFWGRYLDTVINLERI